MKQEWSTTCIHSLLLLSQNHMQIIATWCSAVNEWQTQYQGVAYSRRHVSVIYRATIIRECEGRTGPTVKVGSIKMVKHGGGNAHTHTHTPKSNARQNISYEPYEQSIRAAGA
jgi:hypothetical protein